MNKNWIIRIKANNKSGDITLLATRADFIEAYKAETLIFALEYENEADAKRNFSTVG